MLKIRAFGNTQNVVANANNQVMSRSLNLILVILTLLQSVSGQDSFIRHYGYGSGQGFSLLINTSGNFVIAGTKYQASNHQQFCAYEINMLGDTVSLSYYGTDSLDQANQIIQTLDGGYFLAGSTNGMFSSYRNIYLVRTTSSGDTIWSRSIGGQGEESADGVIQLNSGEFIICGRTKYNSHGLFDFLLIKVDANGDTLWSRVIGGSENEEAKSIQHTSDGGLIIAGYTESYPVGSKNCFLVKTDMSGDTLWTRSYGGSANDYLHAVKQTSDGGYIMTGVTHSIGVSTENMYVIRANSIGDTLWTRSYGQVGRWSWGHDIIETADGGFAITGLIRTASPNGGSDLYFVKVDAMGFVEWEHEFKIEPSNTSYTSSVGHSLLQTPDGGFAIAGRWFNGGTYEVLLIKTQADGTVGIGEMPNASGFEVFPNPFRDYSTLKFNNPTGEPFTMNLYSSSGQLVMTSANIRADQYVIERANLANGLYHVVLHSKSHNFSGRLMVE